MTDSAWTEEIPAHGKTKLTLPDESTVVITKISPAVFQEKKEGYLIEIETTDSEGKNPEKSKLVELFGDEKKPLKINIIAISDIPPVIINNAPFAVKLSGKLFGDGLDEEEEEPEQPEIPPPDEIQARFKKIGEQQGPATAGSE